MKVVKLLLLCSLPILLWSCATTPTGTQASQTAEKRVALVIGNNSYTNFRKSDQLEKAVKDAQDMRDQLRKLGFRVYYGENLPISDMRAQLTKFTSEIDGNTLAFVYYSGHGTSDERGLNYLVPSDYKKEGVKPVVKTSLVAVDEIAFAMKERGSSKNILALDMCRSIGEEDAKNGKGSKALSKGDIGTHSPYNKGDFKDDGVLVSYATGQGSSSFEVNELPNGRYTHFLLKHIKDETLSLSDLFAKVGDEVTKISGKQQIPWKNGSLEGNDIFLAKTAMSSEMGSRP